MSTTDRWPTHVQSCACERGQCIVYNCMPDHAYPRGRVWFEYEISCTDCRERFEISMTNGNLVQIERIPSRRGPDSRSPTPDFCPPAMVGATNGGPALSTAIARVVWALDFKYESLAVIPANRFLNSAGRMPNCTTGHNQPEPQLSKVAR